MKDTNIVRTAIYTAPSQYNGEVIEISVEKNGVYLGGYTIDDENKMSYRID